MSHPRLVLALLPLVLIALSARALAKPASAKPASAKPVKKDAALRGVVEYGGAVAETPADKSSDPVCAAHASGGGALAVDDGKLAGVHVRVRSGSAGKHRPPASPIVIEQKGCEYLPRVAGAMAGQPLVVKNADATLHNVHGYVGDESWFNRSQPKGSPELRQKDLGGAGEVFTLKCDVHPWMRAYIPVTDHPYFDVTDADGTFAIRGLPAGTYTLEAWHPTLGLKSQSVTVGASPAPVTFRYP